ncbi:hypothetical protein M0802_007534 [Mischocyttarus mexicanus]|nr:hypothetical protein M0802_007534 [Mischocyttarus mexicanus]
MRNKQNSDEANIGPYSASSSVPDVTFGEEMMRASRQEKKNKTKMERTTRTRTVALKDWVKEKKKKDMLEGLHFQHTSEQVSEADMKKRRKVGRDEEEEEEEERKEGGESIDKYKDEVETSTTISQQRVYRTRTPGIYDDTKRVPRICVWFKVQLSLLDPKDEFLLAMGWWGWGMGLGLDRVWGLGWECALPTKQVEKEQEERTRGGVKDWRREEGGGGRASVLEGIGEKGEGVRGEADPELRGLAGCGGDGGGGSVCGWG